MKLRKKTLAILFGTVIIMFAILGVIEQIYTQSNIQNLAVKMQNEIANVSQNVQSVNNTVTYEISELNNETQYWARWNETYNFMNNPNQNYINSNLSADTFTLLRINFILFVNSSGQVVFERAFDYLNSTEIAVPQSLQNISSDDPLLQYLTSEKVSGIILLDGNPIIIASQPILNSADAGSSRGTLVMGRFLDSNEINYLMEQSRTNISLSLFNASQLSAEQVASLPIPEPPSVLTQTLTLNDIYGNPILVLRINENMALFQLPFNQYSSQSFLGSALPYLIISLGLVAITLILLEKFVLSRLARLSISVSNIGTSGDLSRRIQVAGKDELSDLTYEINNMLSKLEQSDKTLKESEEKYQTAFASSTDALMLLDEKGFFDCNISTLQLFGYKSLEEFSKNDPAYLSPPTQPDGIPSVEAAEKHIHKALDTGTDHFFWLHKRTDGTVFPADVLYTRMQFKGNNILQATIRDITKQKEAEQKLKDDQEKIALMNEKLQVTGSLTRHDVRNKLSAVNGYAYLLKKKHKDQADIVEVLGKIEQAVEDSVKIFDFARMYEQLGVEELTYVDVGKAVDEAVSLFSGLTIKMVNDCHGLSVLADSFLRQMLYNFLDNTRKYGKKTTIIRVYYEKTDESQLRLIYEDDGVGISKENKPRLFKEGFSTGDSTGFGLFLSQKMIEVYGWQIKEIGEPGKGAEFVMTISKTNKNGQVNYQIQS